MTEVFYFLKHIYATTIFSCIVDPVAYVPVDNRRERRCEVAVDPDVKPDQVSFAILQERILHRRVSLRSSRCVVFNVRAVSCPLLCSQLLFKSYNVLIQCNNQLCAHWSCTKETIPIVACISSEFQLGNLDDCNHDFKILIIF